MRSVEAKEVGDSGSGTLQYASSCIVQGMEGGVYQPFPAVTTNRDGRQGLAQFQVQPVDLVLTDLEMPEMNGLDLILELTRTFLDVKVMAMSGHSAGKLQTARLLGARQTFAKPLNLPELLRAVEYELQH